jgi:hypothetical protein
MPRKQRQKRKACLRARTQGFEPPGMDGAVCKAMMLRIVTPGRHAPIRTRPKVIMSVCPPVDDAHGFSLDMPGVLQALAPCAQAVRHRLRRSGVEEPNHRYCWLLRPRHPWAGNPGAAEQGDELAALCMSGKQHCEGRWGFGHDRLPVATGSPQALRIPNRE